MISPDQSEQPASETISGRGGARNLAWRAGSAVVLAPLALLCAYVGGWIFLLLCLMAAGGILWEWTRLVSRGSDPRVLAPGLATLLAAMVLVGINQPGAGVAAIALGAAIAGAVVVATPPPSAGRSFPIWAVGGVFYAGAAFIGPALLRQNGAGKIGFTALLFLFATVWINDIFSYFIGRAIGGPLLWPRLSPRKTWSGAVGGLAGGVVAGTLVAYANGFNRLAVLAVIAVMLSILAQAGDLLESAVKRRFGAKDSSGLIPGHGGLMDRLDGFLVAALAALVLGIIHHGTDAPAAGLLVW